MLPPNSRLYPSSQDDPSFPSSASGAGPATPWTWIIIGLLMLSLTANVFLATQWANIKAGTETMATDNAKLVRENQQLAGERDALTASNRGLTALNAALTATNLGLATEKRALESANKVLGTKYAELQKGYRDLEGKSHRTLAAVKGFSGSLSERIFKSATRNVAAMAGEAIPFIGASVTFAVTALDLKDACDTIKELNVVNAEIGVPREDESSVCGIRPDDVSKLVTTVKDNWRKAYASAASAANQGQKMLPEMPPTVSMPQIGELLYSIFGKRQF